MSLVASVLWTASRVAVLPLVGLILVYRASIAKVLSPRCRFHPSCSAYAIDALRMNGLLGVGQAAWRVARCAPWTNGGTDEPRPLRPSRRLDSSGTILTR